MYGAGNHNLQVNVYCIDWLEKYEMLAGDEGARNVQREISLQYQSDMGS
jgi:hypothetical protein